MKTPDCGDRRCTLEAAEARLAAFQGDPDRGPGEDTRIKTELDELAELLARARAEGAAAWEALRERAVAALDRLGL